MLWPLKVLAQYIFLATLKILDSAEHQSLAKLVTLFLKYFQLLPARAPCLDSATSGSGSNASCPDMPRFNQNCVERTQLLARG